MQPTPVFLPGELHGQRSLVGYSPWGRKESDMPEQLTPHYMLSTNKDHFKYNDITRLKEKGWKKYNRQTLLERNPGGHIHIRQVII